jgi:hypothetical protein
VPKPCDTAAPATPRQFGAPNAPACPFPSQPRCGSSSRPPGDPSLQNLQNELGNRNEINDHVTACRALAANAAVWRNKATAPGARASRPPFPCAERAGRPRSDRAYRRNKATAAKPSDRAGILAEQFRAKTPKKSATSFRRPGGCGLRLRRMGVRRVVRAQRCPLHVQPDHPAVPPLSRFHARAAVMAIRAAFAYCAA